MVLQTGPTKRQIITMERAKRLRRKQTTTEMLLWRRLRNHRSHGLKCRRQVPIGPWIVDFYIAKKKLVIEIDGNVHEERHVKIEDPKRQKYLERNGYRVIRFTNDEVNNDIERVLASITRQASLCNSAPYTLSPNPSPLAKGEGRKNAAPRSVNRKIQTIHLPPYSQGRAHIAPPLSCILSPRERSMITSPPTLPSHT